jgi:DNA repair protein RadC
MMSRVCESVVRYGAVNKSESDLLSVLGISISLGQVMSGTYAGLKPKELARVESLAELMRRGSLCGADRPRITSPRAAGEYLMTRCNGWTEERFGLLALNAKGDLLAERIISRGLASATLVSPREFFREALQLSASSAIAFHNHPSGDPTPSREDIQLTRRMRDAGNSLGVPLADHIVVGGDRYHSFRAAEGGWDNTTMTEA